MKYLTKTLAFLSSIAAALVISCTSKVEDVPSISFKPDYEKDLSHLIITHNRYKETEGKSADPVDERFRKETGIESRIRLIESLPGYSSILLITDKESKEEFEKKLKRKNVVIKSADMEQPRDSFAQDMGAGNFPDFILRKDYPYIEQQLREYGLNVTKHLSNKDGWGNILKGKNKNKEKILFIGSGLLENDRIYLGLCQKDVLEMYRRTFTADKTIVLENTTMHPRLSSRSLIHLDQVVSFLGDGDAAAARLPDIPEDISRLYGAFLREFGKAKTTSIDPKDIMDYFVLKEAFFPEKDAYAPVLYTTQDLSDSLTREQYDVLIRFKEFLGFFYHAYISQSLAKNEDILKKNGFDVHPLCMDMLNLTFRQCYANSLVYTNKENNQKEILFPVFYDTKRLGGNEKADPMLLTFPKEYNSKVVDGKEELISMLPRVYDGIKVEDLDSYNIKKLKELGFNVISVKSEELRGGNIHCLVNPL